jgi:hypothetical protein
MPDPSRRSGRRRDANRSDERIHSRSPAEDTGHTLTEQDEDGLREDLQTVEDVDAGIIMKQEAMVTRPSGFIATYNP